MLEREVRANLVYRQFTRVGAQKVPDAKTLGDSPLALGPEIIEQIHRRVVEHRPREADRTRTPAARGHHGGGDRHPLPDRQLSAGRWRAGLTRAMKRIARDRRPRRDQTARSQPRA